MIRPPSRIRGVVQSVVEGAIKRFFASGRADELFADREYMQHYGFTSRPLAGAEIVVLAEGNHIIAIASDDRRYRVAVENGEVALYSDEGDVIHLKRGREIHVASGGKVTVEAETLIDLKTGAGVTKGIVQGDCICHFTGSPHADISTTVKASK